MRTYIYIDGFNLYYGALKGTPYKWLDVKALFGAILRPDNEILKIKYYTARVSARPTIQMPRQGRISICKRLKRIFQSCR